MKAGKVLFMAMVFIIACNNKPDRNRPDSTGGSSKPPDSPGASSKPGGSGGNTNMELANCISPCEISVRMGHPPPGFNWPGGSDASRLKLNPAEELSFKNALKSMAKNDDPKAHMHADVSGGQLAFKPELVRSAETDAHVTGNEPQIQIRNGASVSNPIPVVPSNAALAELSKRIDKGGVGH
jgi:hypothetical protein